MINSNFVLLFQRLITEVARTMHVLVRNLQIQMNTIKLVTVELYTNPHDLGMMNERNNLQNMQYFMHDKVLT